LEYKINVTEEDRAQADAAIDFIVESLSHKTPESLSDYCHNLLVALKQNSVSPRLSGIVASAIPYYLREIGKMEESKRESTPSKHFGSSGERMDFRATLLGVFPIETDFGATFITKMITTEGNLVTWFASKDCSTESPDDAQKNGLLCKGVEVKITGTIKKHDTYQGKCQTVVTRCTIWTQEGERQAEEKAVKKAARAAKKAKKLSEQVDSNSKTL
jgi:hypothetical protein